MNEEETETQTGYQEQTSVNTGEGHQPQETELSQQESFESKRLEKAQARKANTQRMKAEADALEKLGGKTDAGAPVPKPRAISPQEYANQVLQGNIPK